jgi:cytochrome c
MHRGPGKVRTATENAIRAARVGYAIVDASFRGFISVVENRMETRVYSWLLAAICAAYTGAKAQGCPTPTSGQFKKVNLVNADLDKPDHMAVLPDGRVFMTEMRSGRVVLFTPDAGLTEAVKVAVYSDETENGMLGIAADPDFATSNWVYVFYSRKLPGSSYNAGDAGVLPHEQVIVRFTFSGGKLINPKEILIVPRLSRRHAAGGMTFNRATGDLFITTGDDVYPSSDLTKYGGRQEGTKYLNSLATAANTNDLRGKTLRIRPIKFPDSQAPAIGVDKTYTIPAGNLFPPGTEKTRPEVYTMGHRNPYKFKIDQVSGVGIIGEVGPDGRSDDAAKGPIGYDEFNLVEKAGNFGWPFGIANNLPYKAIAGEAYPVGTQFNMGSLKNLSASNTGLADLPPAVGAIGYYAGKTATNSVMTPFGSSGGQTAIAGPYYRYDAELNSTVKLPAFFHGKFIVSCWSRNKIWTLELDNNNKLVKVQDIFATTKAIDLDIGPKGELYVLEYADNNGYHGTDGSGKLYKLEYTGAQYAASGCPQSVLQPKSVSLASSARGGMAAAGHRLVNLAVTGQVAAPSGMRKGILYDLKGGRMWEGRVRNARLILPAALESNLAYLQFE